MSNNRDIAIKGGLWTSISTVVSLFASLFRVMILARFLEKSDFGVVSIINMVIGLSTTFTDLGFSSVIMYRQKLSDNEFSSLFWMQMIFFLLIYGILCILSPMISYIYSEPTLSLLIPIASVSILFQAIGKLYDSVLQKNYLFRLLAFRNICSTVVSLFVAVIMAWKGYGVYSLIYSTLIQVAIINIWNFKTGSSIYNIRLVFCFREICGLVKIGIYQTGTSVLDFLSGKLDVIIIGRMLGMEALGLYDLSKELVYKLVSFIQNVVSKVALPILANNNTQNEVVVRSFLKITKVVSYICFPLCITVATFSDFIVRIAYGVKFIETAPLVSIFSMVTMITCLSSFFDMLGITKGRTDLNFKNTVYRILITIPMIVMTCNISLLAVAVGILLSTLIRLSIYWRVVVRKTYPMPFKLYLHQFSKIGLIELFIGLTFYSILHTDYFVMLYENNLFFISGIILLYIIVTVVFARIFLCKDLNLLMTIFIKK